jgi:hypothetical protein
MKIREREIILLSLNGYLTPGSTKATFLSKLLDLELLDPPYLQ